jgi:hypothetical protein
MKFTVRYWCLDLEYITGYARGDEISETQVMQLITDTKVNVMIHHNENNHTCFIDDEKFQQR